MADAQTVGGTVVRESAAAVLRDRYVIVPAAPLPDFCTVTAQAFVAEDRRDSSAALYALISHPQLPPRTDVMRLMKGVRSPGLNQLVEWGVVHWDPAGGECVASVYTRPASGRLMVDMAAKQRPLREAEITQKIIAPMMGALREYDRRGLTHRAIRPTNMFYLDTERDHVVLGDGASSPAAIDQPYISETIESCMCHPAARGPGRMSDDLYALGVAILMLMHGRNPLSHLEDDDIIRLKMTKGSYNALAGEMRPPPALVEILRGLLSDDVADRWRLEHVEMWLSGRRLRPLQTKREKKAGGAFSFDGQDFYSARKLGMAFSNNWDLAITHVTEGQLEIWLRQALDDKEKADQIAIAMAEAAGTPGERHRANDLMMAKICMILDNTSPIRYKGLNVMPDGYGSYLAYIFLQRQDSRLLVEAIQREIPKLWLRRNNPFQVGNARLESSFCSLRGYFLQISIGYGIERALYELNGTLSCQSPLMGERYVVDIKQLLPALDVMARDVDQKTFPIDRHIAAFIASRFSQDVEKHLNALNSYSAGYSCLGMLGLLASVQWHLGIGNVPRLTAWVGTHLTPAINNFHDRATRRALERDLPKVMRTGSLVDMYRMLDNPEVRNRDQKGFSAARHAYATARQRIADLETGQDKKEEIDRVGKKTAALLSVFLGFGSVILFTMLRVG